jgi:hypothetical protein
MLNLREGDIDVKLGYFIIPHPKEKRPKLVPIIDEDIEILSDMPRGLPGLYFFRHQTNVAGVKAGARFGNRYFYKWWAKACLNMGVNGVDLYGGTRHSTSTHLRKFYSPEEIMRFGTLHSTNKAFERYFQIKSDDSRKLYELAKGSHKREKKVKTRTT